MASNTSYENVRYEPVSHGGLEVAPNQSPSSAVVSGTGANAPVAYQDHDANAPIPQDEDGSQYPKDHSYYARGTEDPVPQYEKGNYASGVPPALAAGRGSTGYQPYHASMGDVSNNNGEPQKESRRRLCGLPTWAFILLIALVAIVIILAIALGAYFGVTHKKSTDNSANSPQPGNDTSGNPDGGAYQKYPIYGQSGMASIYVGDSTNALITYVQDSNGNIVENVWGSNQVSPQTFAKSVTQTTVVAPAKNGYPIAAITYPYGKNQVTRKHVFYFDTNGNLTDIMQTANTTNPPWVPGDLQNSINAANAAEDYEEFTSYGNLPSVALTACYAPYSTFAKPGIRVYVGLNYAADGESSQYIQEFGVYNVSENQAQIWNIWHYFEGANAYGGAACTVHESVLNLYYQNSSTQAIQQMYYDFNVSAQAPNNTNSGWNNGPEWSPSDGAELTANPPISATTNGTFDIVDTVLQNGTVWEFHGRLNYNNSMFGSGYPVAAGLLSDTKVLVSWIKNGTVSMFQDPNKDLIAIASNDAQNPAVNQSLPISNN